MKPAGGLDARLLRRARHRSVGQTVAAIGVVLLLVGVVMFALTTREQSRALDTDLAQVVAEAEDVDDPPPGQFLARQPASGRGSPELTPGTAPEVGRTLTAALRRPAGHFDTSVDDDLPIRVLVAHRADGSRWAVAADLSGLRRQRTQLIGALLLAEFAGLAGAVLAAALLSRRAVAPLAAALAIQRRFVADASHELRAPLTVLHTRAQLLARRARSSNRPTNNGPTSNGPTSNESTSDRPAGERRASDGLASDLDQLVLDARALGEVVEDLLISAEAEHRPVPDTTVDFAALASEVVASMSAYADSRQIALGLTGSGPALVRGARTPLRRALTALIDNALGHVAEGGHVRVSVASAGGRVRVSVADNGVGLDPADTDRLFHRFAHGRAGAGRRFGLGLALVQHVAQAHHGSVEVTGAPGRGATFTIVLPAA